MTDPVVLAAAQAKFDDSLHKFHAFTQSMNLDTLDTSVLLWQILDLEMEFDDAKSELKIDITGSNYQNRMRILLGVRNLKKYGVSAETERIRREERIQKSIEDHPPVSDWKKAKYVKKPQPVAPRPVIAEDTSDLSIQEWLHGADFLLVISTI